MKIGYARVSTLDQNLELQLDALKKAGCERIYEDRISGASVERPGWTQVETTFREGDVVVVWRLDRLGRSIKHLIDTVGELEERGVGILSLTENIDTTTSSGRLFFHIFSALAEFERNLIRERTAAGLAAARARGRKGGRPKKLTDKKLVQARKLLADGSAQVHEVAETLGVSRATLYRALASTSGSGSASIER